MGGVTVEGWIDFERGIGRDGGQRRKQKERANSKL